MEKKGNREREKEIYKRRKEKKEKRWGSKKGVCVCTVCVCVLLQYERVEKILMVFVVGPRSLKSVGYGSLSLFLGFSTCWLHTLFPKIEEPQKWESSKTKNDTCT